MRWLAKCAWLSTRRLPGPGVGWAGPDDHVAHLTYTHEHQAVTWLSRFNEHGGQVACKPMRYFGDTTLLPG